MLKFIFIATALLLTLLACIPRENSLNQNFVSEENDTTKYCKYSWTDNIQPQNNLINRINLPDGFKRTNLSHESFGYWLRHLPLKNVGSTVKLYNGSLKSRQDVHAAIINIDPGTEDLQQCADACMRLKAEYHYSRGEHTKIHFKFTSGDIATWENWSKGYRPIVNGNKVEWKKKTGLDTSYINFRAYLATVFRYAGTYSLNNELSVIQKNELEAGDLFIQGGFPGHAVIIVDVAENIITKEKIFLLAQSYMPAQEIHILKNFNDKELSPWYSSNFIEELDTPEWTFTGNCLRRFK